MFHKPYEFIKRCNYVKKLEKPKKKKNKRVPVEHSKINQSSSEYTLWGCHIPLAIPYFTQTIFNIRYY